MTTVFYTGSKPKKKALTAKQIKDRAATKAAAKALEESWDNLPKFASKNRSDAKVVDVTRKGPPPLTAPPGRETKKLPSKVTPGGEAVKAPDKVYTGTAMKGVATMHKSNSVPVFDDQHLVDIANMRRNDYMRDVKKTPIDDATSTDPLIW